MPSVAILMGSQSDMETMQKAGSACEELGISSETFVISAHRNPEKLQDFVKTATEKFDLIIAGAGLAAHLPGVVASLTPLPVIGVPIAAGPLNGQDALFSIVQMPKGVPVATVGINNAFNAGLLAGRILALSSEAVKEKLKSYLEKLKSS